jgi:ribosomal protein S18 acetylase RimI-like enzyme
MNIRSMKKADFDNLLTVIDAWWGGRTIHPLLHPVYLYQFGNMATVAEENGSVVGFLVGFISQTQPDQAYIHLVGTAPEARKHGVARTLYEHFFAEALAHGCRQVKAITSPTNQGSIDFHQRLGFSMSMAKNYSGPGQDRMVFVRHLQENALGQMPASSGAKKLLGGVNS